MATGFNTQTGSGEYRLQFETDNKELFLLMQETARRCVDGKPNTNADRIRAMSDEELAAWMARKGLDAMCSILKVVGVKWVEAPELEDAVRKDNLQWLKQPVEE